MENISPVIFFIIYLAITAWAKQRKAQAKKAAESPGPATVKKQAAAKPQEPKLPSFFEQIKQELLEMQEDQPKPVPPPFVQMKPEAPAKPEKPTPNPEPVMVFHEEGSEGIREYRREVEEHMKIPEEGAPDHNLIWDQILASYSTVERGIVLREVLGPPRALQSREQWIHSY